VTAPEPRTVARSVLMWAFGLAVSVLLISMWGRAVVIDSETLGESLSPLSNASVVRGFLTDWLTEQLSDTGVEAPAMRQLLDSSAVGSSLDEFVVEVVRAAASTDPGGSSVDMVAIIDPAVPELTAGLVGMGYPVSEGQVSALVTGFDPLEIRPPGALAFIGPGSPMAARLGMAALLASVALVVLGSGVVYLSEDRIAAVRSLVTRVAVGALSFAVLLRLGSWVLDPSGGRAPVTTTLSALAGSKWLVPLEVAFVAGAVAGGVYLVKRWWRRGEASPLRGGQSTPQPDQSESLSESR
jgi:hypothetical protein